MDITQTERDEHSADSPEPASKKRIVPVAIGALVMVALAAGVTLSGGSKYRVPEVDEDGVPYATLNVRFAQGIIDFGGTKEHALTALNANADDIYDYLESMCDMLAAAPSADEIERRVAKVADDDPYDDLGFDETMIELRAGARARCPSLARYID